MSKLKDPEDIKHVCVDSDCDDDLSINGSLSLYLPEEDTEDGYDVVEIITKKSDYAKYEDIASLPAAVPAIRKRKRDNQANIKKQAERVECGHCHKLYHQNYMHIHNRIHTGERPFKCKLCPEDFKNIQALKCHMRIHYGDRPNVCTVCGASFRKKNALDNHTLGHTGVRPYKCEICGKTFQRKGTRDEHYTSHSNTKSFICPECPKRFTCNKLLKRHMVRHAKIKPNECTFCGKQFAESCELRRHQTKSCKLPGNEEDSLV